LHVLSGSDDEKPIRLLAVEKCVSDVCRIGNVDVDIVTDFDSEPFEFGAGDIDSPGVTCIPGDGFASHLGYYRCFSLPI
jgi:hypothetical protein